MSNTPYQPWMRSLLNRMKELYGKVDAKTIAEALPDGNFFKIKGSVATYGDLPATGNNVGDIYIVSADGGEYIWVTSETYPDGYWEKLGSEASGGAELFIVTFTYDSTFLRWNSDKTYVEIAAAEDAGKILVFCVDGFLGLAQYVEESGEQMYKSVILTSARKMYAVWTAANGFVGIVVSDYKLAKALNIVQVSGTTPTIDVQDNTRYRCGELTSLTVTNSSATANLAEYSIEFTSGSTPTTTTFPSNILGLENFAAEANTIYEINVAYNRAVVGSWAVSA